VDIVVEAANIEAVHALFPAILPKKDVIIISIGALADTSFFQKMNDLAHTYGRTIHLPSGAIGGLDLLQNAHADQGVKSVALTTRKQKESLTSDQHLTEEKVNLEEQAQEAIKQFQKNINVAIILSLAGKGVNETRVTIIADPAIRKNI